MQKGVAVERAEWSRHLGPGVEHSSINGGKEFQRPQPPRRFFGSRWRAQREGGAEEGKWCPETHRRAAMTSLLRSFWGRAPLRVGTGAGSRVAFPGSHPESTAGDLWVVGGSVWGSRSDPTLGKTRFVFYSLTNTLALRALLIRRVPANPGKVSRSTSALQEGSHLPPWPSC